MSEFINTVDVIGDEALVDSIINGRITEYKDNVITKCRQRAFSNCTALTIVDLPNVNSIASNAFRYCSALTSVNLPKVTSIPNYVFFYCTSLESIDLPKVTMIEQSFVDCSKLNTLILRSQTVCSLSTTNAFSNTPFATNSKPATLYVPQALIASYKTATNWSSLIQLGKCSIAAIEGSQYE